MRKDDDDDGPFLEKRSEARASASSETANLISSGCSCSPVRGSHFFTIDNFLLIFLVLSIIDIDNSFKSLIISRSNCIANLSAFDIIFRFIVDPQLRAVRRKIFCDSCF